MSPPISPVAGPRASRLPCVFLAFLALGGSVSAQEECGPGGILEGRILDAASGVPLPGARVLVALTRTGVKADPPDDAPLDPVEAVAGADGSYRVCGLPFGRWLRVRATLAGQEGETAEVRLVPGRPHGRDLVLSVAGRDPGRVVGRVTDRETHRPVTAATVSLEPLSPTARGAGPRRVATDGNGYFRIDEVPPGIHRLAVAHLGYAPVTEEVEVPAHLTVEVDTELSADPVELEPLVVTTVRDPRLEMHGFYERKRWGERLGLGGFFTRKEIEERRPQRISHMVGDLPGVHLRCRGARGCEILFTRARNIRTMGRCPATVYLDGVKVGASLDEYVLPTEVAGVEVYKGAASLPASFGGSDAQCGVVAVWTRGG